MINIHTAFLHDFFEVVVGNGIAKIEEDSEQDHVLREVTAFKTDYEGVRHRGSLHSLRRP